MEFRLQNNQEILSFAKLTGTDRTITKDKGLNKAWSLTDPRQNLITKNYSHCTRHP